MEDELWKRLYPLVQEEHNRRPRRKRVQFSDAIILLVALWAILHDRPISWACRADHWHGTLPWLGLPSPATMSRRLRTLSVTLLLEQVFYRLGSVAAVSGFCLCRTIDSKPLAVGGFSKDRDARWGYATGGKYKGYKMFCCWGKAPTVPEALSLGPMNQSDQAGGMMLIDRLDQLHCGNASGYLLADAAHDTNPLHAHAAAHGLQLLTPRKQPGSDVGHRTHAPQRLRSIALLEPPPVPPKLPASRLGPELYRRRGEIERDLGQPGNFGGGLQPLPAWVRRPHRVALWVIGKLIINGMRICQIHGLTA
jgi:hypothetical protein